LKVEFVITYILAQFKRVQNRSNTQTVDNFLFFCNKFTQIKKRVFFKLLFLSYPMSFLFATVLRHSVVLATRRRVAQQSEGGRPGVKPFSKTLWFQLVIFSLYLHSASLWQIPFQVLRLPPLLSSNHSPLPSQLTHTGFPIHSPKRLPGL